MPEKDWKLFGDPAKSKPAPKRKPKRTAENKQLDVRENKGAPAPRRT